MTEAADDRRAAVIIRSSSIRFSLTGGHVGCTMYTSRPRTFVASRTLVSPSANVLALLSASYTPMASAASMVIITIKLTSNRRATSKKSCTYCDLAAASQMSPGAVVPNFTPHQYFVLRQDAHCLTSPSYHLEAYFWIGKTVWFRAM